MCSCVLHAPGLMQTCATRARNVTGAGSKPKRVKEALQTQPLRKLSRVSIGWNKGWGKLGSEAAVCCLLPAVLEEGLV